MLQPRRTPARRHWENLTDDQLLNVELTTDDPEQLENLVTKFPEGDDEPYVEFKYDMRGSGRPEFTCVHGHHGHLAGFVMRKGTLRFLVGWMCGAALYGQNFEGYKNDYNAAVNRQVTLRRRREIEREILPLLAWMQQVSQCETFRQYDRVRQQISDRLPWLWDNAPRATYAGVLSGGVKLPTALFNPDTDPEADFAKVIAEASTLAISLKRQDIFDKGTVSKIKITVGGIIRRIEAVLNCLGEVLDFFQPAALQALCDLANEHDNPSKRKYEPGLMSLTCMKSGKDKLIIRVPKNYRVPDASGLRNLTEAIRKL